MPDDLFVYGTLRSEFDNPYARKLRSEADSLGPATVRGSIFYIRGYPGYRREPDGIVRGELWRLREPDKTLAALDEYEGSDYSRLVVSLDSPPGEAWIYLYTGNVNSDLRIASGDFVEP